VLEAAGPEDRFLFATTLDGDQTHWRKGFASDASAVRQALGNARTQYGTHRPDRALESAFALLDEVDGGKVALATDLQAAGWSEGRITGTETVPLHLFDVGFPSPSNTWVEAIEEGVGLEGGIKVRLRSVGISEERRTVHLLLGERPKLTAFLDGDEALFQTRLPSAAYTGRARVEPGGDLVADDELAFVGRGRLRTRVLLVNGDPRGFEIRDELLFVRRAFAPGTRLERNFAAREVRVGDLTAAELEEAEVFVLANPGPLANGIAALLEQRVTQGAGLIVTAGDRWDAAGDTARTTRRGSPSNRWTRLRSVVRCRFSRKGPAAISRGHRFANTGSWTRAPAKA
jgi:hypothetical protein